MADWDAWFKSRPGLDPQSEQTAVILYTLHTVQATAPFEWGLTGGTALQSYFPDKNRRYSNDVEIITKATRMVVEQWMRDRGWVPEDQGGDVTKGTLPNGTLYVFHDYDSAGYAAAGPAPTPFRHYPLSKHTPPETLTLPLLAYDFLIAAKIFGAQEPRRGGERTKDIQDLCAGVAAASKQNVAALLPIYLQIKRAGVSPQETLRAAGVWVQYFRDRGHGEFVKWRKKWVVDPSAFQEKEALTQVLEWLERLFGGKIRPGANEIRRFMLEDLSLKEVGKIGTTFGYKGRLSMETQKLFDFIADKAFPLLGPTAPSSPQELLSELQAVSGRGANT